MLAVQQASKAVITPIIEPTQPIKLLAERVVISLVKFDFMYGWSHDQSAEFKKIQTDYIVRCFCHIEKANFHAVRSNAINLSFYCGMDQEDVTNYVELSGYKIQWLKDKHLSVFE